MTKRECGAAGPNGSRCREDWLHVVDHYFTDEAGGYVAPAPRYPRGIEAARTAAAARNARQFGTDPSWYGR